MNNLSKYALTAWICLSLLAGLTTPSAGFAVKAKEPEFDKEYKVAQPPGMIYYWNVYMARGDNLTIDIHNASGCGGSPNQLNVFVGALGYDDMYNFAVLDTNDTMALGGGSIFFNFNRNIWFVAGFDSYYNLTVYPGGACTVNYTLHVVRGGSPTSRLDALEANMTAMTTTVQSLSTNITTIWGNLTNLWNNVSKTVNTTKIEADIAELQYQVGLLTTLLNGLALKVDEISTTIDNLDIPEEVNLTELYTNLSVLQQKFTLLAQEYNDLSENVSKLSSGITYINTTNNVTNNVTQNITTYDMETVSKIYSDVNDTLTDISRIETQLGLFNQSGGNDTSVYSTLNSVQKEVWKLQNATDDTPTNRDMSAMQQTGNMTSGAMLAAGLAIGTCAGVAYAHKRTQGLDERLTYLETGTPAPSQETTETPFVPDTDNIPTTEAKILEKK